VPRVSLDSGSDIIQISYEYKSKRDDMRREIKAKRKYNQVEGEEAGYEWKRRGGKGEDITTEAAKC
jgi:hypothetical protein